jgi:glycosyltransferase involved in cell wall biosynthesis
LGAGLKIVYLCYPISDAQAPHPPMGALALARQGSSITFIAWGNSATPGWLSEYGLAVRYLLYPKQGWLSALRLLFGVMRTVVTVQPDCVYVQGAQQTPFALWLLLAGRRFRCIYHTQDYVGPGQNWFYETSERLLARHADWVISNEVNRARFMASSYRLKRLPEVIRTALPRWWQVPGRDERYRQELLRVNGLIDIDQPRLIAAGGAYREDRMSAQLVDALVHLPANYILVFTGMDLGSAGKRLCEQHMRRVGIEGRGVFLEAPDYAQLLKLLAACDVGMLLYPNNCIGHFYQAPGRLTEYLRCGLPIVTSNFPGLEQLVLKYGLGEVADPYSPMSIAAAIRSVCDVSVGEFARLRLRLIELAQTELAYEAQAEQVFDKILHDIARERSSGNLNVR